jgi:hypothetical protein
MTIKIYFYNGTSAATASHYFQKEYRNDIIVEIEGLFYEVYFFTKDALEYEMRNDGFFSLPGIIILDEISTDKILNAIEHLSKINFFSSFTGHYESPINNRFVKQWYLNEQTEYDTSELYVHTLE